jgi:hypothetical protein
MKKTIKKLFRKYLVEQVLNLKVDLHQDELNEILKGYLEAALWTEEENLNNDAKDSLDYNQDEYDDIIDDEEDEIEKLLKIKRQFENKDFQRFILDDLEPNSKIQAYLDIKTFINLAGEDAVLEAVNDNGYFRLGMDIWLTRNHHGSGFFDRNYENEDSLTNAAHKLREVDLYITDNNTLAFSNAY